MLNLEIKHEIINHALSSPNEVCGFIKMQGDILVIEKKENILNSATQFMMEGIDGDTVAYYHSHIDYDRISREDEIVSERLGLPCIVYNKNSNTFHQYNPNGLKIQYTERPFVLGFADCLWLVKDYYSYNLNIDLASEQEIIKNNASQEEYDILVKQRCINEVDFLKTRSDYLKKYFELNGFKGVESPKKNDILITRTANYNFPIHCMIFLGGDKVLHHPGNSISKEERLSRLQKKWVIYTMRHNLL